LWARIWKVQPVGPQQAKPLRCPSLGIRACRQDIAPTGGQRAEPLPAEDAADRLPAWEGMPGHPGDIGLD
jgi:hypothetical protein